MRKFIISLAYFTLFIICFYCFLIILLGENSSDRFKKNLLTFTGVNCQTYMNLKEVETVKNIDLLFIGSSHCYRGFDPRIFKQYGINSYNLGTSSQTPIQSELFFQKYLNRLKPKSVILEVNPLIFSLDGLESTLDIISNQYNDYLSLKMALDYSNVKVINTLIYSYYGDAFNQKKDVIEDYEKDAGKYITRGYVEKKTMYLERETHEKKSFIIDENQLITFDRILKLLQEKHIKVILIQAPITKSLYNSYRGMERFDSLMKSKGVYYNFNNELNLNDSLYFYDSDHLNQKGVEIFNRKLIQYIKL